MAIARLQLLKMAFTETSFCTENASAVTQYDIRANNLDFSIEQQAHERQHRVQRLTMKAGRVLGRKSARLGFSVDMVGDGVVLTASATPADDSLQLLLKRTLGNSSSAAGSLVAAGATSKTVIPTTASQGSRFPAGSLVMIASVTSGGVARNEIRPVASIGTSHIRLAIETTATATVGAKIYNSYSAYIDPSATSTMQAQIIGDDNDDDVFLALGVAGGVTFENLLQQEDVARAVFDLAVTKWETDTATIAAGSYDGADPLTTTEEMEVHYQTAGTATKNLINVTDLQVAPGVAWTPFIARGSSDREHVSRIVMTGVAPTVEFTADNDDAFLTIHAARTKKHMLLTFGRTAGSSWAIWMPNLDSGPQVPQRSESAEQTTKTVQLEAHEGTGSTTLARSPIVVGRL
jgi:DNA-binding transcriptional regulator YdaS (Cro superfamily)